MVWASGRFGTFVKTTDGGKTWHPGVVAGAERFSSATCRVSDKVAYLLSIGTGTDSRIYKTTDGGNTWTMQFQNQDPTGFYDCFAFWGPNRAITMADSINGRFPVIRTLDGSTWQDIGDRLPPALPGEAGFAASGTCAATQGKRNAWLATGGTNTTARILSTRDRGQTWTAANVPLTVGVDFAGGATSVGFRDGRHGFAAGGDLAVTDIVDNFARSGMAEGRGRSPPGRPSPMRSTERPMPSTRRMAGTTTTTTTTTTATGAGTGTTTVTTASTGSQSWPPHPRARRGALTRATAGRPSPAPRASGRWRSPTRRMAGSSA